MITTTGHGMMIPKYLRLSGFLSYKDPIELDFTGFELACISGSNGAGKSSLLDAITWALFGQARRRDDAIINSYATSAEIIFDYWYENSLYRVQRIKPNGKTCLLELYIDDGGNWKPLTEHSLRETEARIQRILRMDFETFTNASFFLQGKADQFAQQRPGDRKRILTSILGLETWEVYRERAVERRKRYENDLNAIDSVLREIHAELDEEEQRKARLKELQENLARLVELRQAKTAAFENLRRLKDSLDEQRRMVEMLSTQLATLNRRIENRQRILEQRQEERLEYQQRLTSAAEIEAAYQEWQAARAGLERWEGVASNFRQYEAQRSAPLMAIENERARLETTRQGLLEQESQGRALEAQLPAMTAGMEAAHQQVTQAKERLEMKTSCEAMLVQVQDEQSEASAENKRLKAEMAELKERIDRLEDASGALCPLCGQPLAEPERLALIESLKARGTELGDRYRANQERVRLGDDRRKMVSEEIKQIQQVEGELRQYQRALDQYEDRCTQAQRVLELWQSSGAQQLAEIERRLASSDYAHAAREELNRVDGGLARIGYDTIAHDSARRREQEGRAAEEQLRQLETARAALAPLQREIESSEAQLKTEMAERIELEQAHTTAAAQYAAESANLPNLQQAEQDLFDLQEQENRMRMQVGGAAQAVEVLKTLRKRHAEKTGQRAETAGQIARLKTLERAFSKDGVPALLIEQALPEIEAQANELLDRLTNGNMSVRFATQKDYKDKDRADKKETLDILISDSAGWRAYEMFSGGEAFRVNFAIRVALSRVLAQRAGARLQTLVIDEGFGSQDAEGRQRLIEAINLVRSDFAKILVVTHLEELKEAFPARIEIEKGAQGSRIRVVV
ncbi:MAG TPA: SMC family ATPase [Levilinea sp.]|nr:SMC family ATPase [Levilinea sp.]